MDDSGLDEARLRGEARRILQELGPLTTGQLSTQLEARDVAVPAAGDLFGLLLQEVPGQFAAFPLVDSRLADLDHMLDGMHLTHVVTDDSHVNVDDLPEPDVLATEIADELHAAADEFRRLADSLEQGLS